MNTRVAIIIPCFKANKKIGIFSKKLIDICDYFKNICLINIYLVNDCCPLNSWKEIYSREKIRIIHHKNNLGVGAATLTGFKKALNDGNEYFIKMDADGQHPAEYLFELIPYLISLPSNQLVFVKGSRFSLPTRKEKIPLIRRLGSFFLEPIARISLSYKGLTDIANGFISLNQITLEYIISQRFSNPIEPRYLFESSIIKACSNLGVEIHEFNMHSIYGSQWTSSMNSYQMIFPLLYFWAKSIISRVLSRYFYRFNFGSFLLITSLLNLLISVLIFYLKVIPMIFKGIYVTPGNASAFTSSFILFVTLFCFFIIYDFSNRVNVKRVFFRISAKKII